MKELTNQRKTSLLFRNSTANRIPPKIAKFIEWTFTEEINTAFIKVAKNSRKNHIVYVSQTYSPAVTDRRNETTKGCKQLRNENKQIHNLGKSIWNKMEESSKTGQRKKSLVSVFALTAIGKV